MHVDQPRHHETAGVVDHPVGHAARRRRCLGADERKAAAFVEHQNLATPRLVLAPVNSVPHRTKVFIANS